MNPLCNPLATALLAALIGGCLPALAAVPLRWTVETSRANVQRIDVYRGETVSIAADFASYGQPLEMAGEAALYVQTNGMGAAWWTIPAAVSSNRIEAVLAPTNYPSAATLLNCYLGGPATSYRAAFQARILGSPGATPNILELPPVTYDAALYGTPTVNGTNLTEWVAARSGEEYDPRAPGIVSNVVTKAYVESLGISGGSDAGAVKAAAGSATNLTVYGSLYIRDPAVSDGIGWINFEGYDANSTTWTIGTTGDPLGTYKLREGSSDETFAFLSDLAVYTPLSAYAATTNTVKAWETYWSGEDVRVTITNYYGSLDIPALYIEQNTNTASGGSAVYRTVWDERTRWNAFLPGYNSFTNDVRQNYADRAWGVYEASTGAYSPDGLLQIATPEIQIASGLAYQRTVTTGGCAVWLLTSTEPTTYSGTVSNGYFRISDSLGNALFEIVKGDKRTVGATASGLSMDGTTMTVTYNVTSDAHPDVHLAAALDGTWYGEDDDAYGGLATVSWSGSSGAWVATIAPVGTRSMLFAQASYTAGGNTYIKNNVAHSADKVVIGGVEYTVTVETVNGKKLMVLE